jgi:hypothetical protein
MDPIYKPLTKEEKAELEARGLKEWGYFGMSSFNDPDSSLCIEILK